MLGHRRHHPRPPVPTPAQNYCTFKLSFSTTQFSSTPRLFSPSKKSTASAALSLQRDNEFYSTSHPPVGLLVNSPRQTKYPVVPTAVAHPALARCAQRPHVVSGPADHRPVDVHLSRRCLCCFNSAWPPRLTPTSQPVVTLLLLFCST